GVFGRAWRVECFDLDVEVDVRRRELADLYDRSVPDGLENVCVFRHGKSGWEDRLRQYGQSWRGSRLRTNPSPGQVDAGGWGRNLRRGATSRRGGRMPLSQADALHSQYTPPDTAQTGVLAPVRPEERIHALDLLRGWAMFGVLWSNVND